MTQDDLLGCGRTRAKTISWQMAEACMKTAGSPYRIVYDTAKAHAVETHPEWTIGHRHKHALRIVAKRILQDLWRVRQNLPPTTHHQTTPLRATLLVEEPESGTE